MTVPVRSLPVVVVGAGPTGSCAALGLAARGVPCVVLDRWERVYPQPRAVHLDDEVYRALARLGLGAELAGLTRPGGGLRLVDAALSVLAEFSRDGVSPVNGYPRANMFDQPALDAVLRARLLAHEAVTFLGGHEVTGVEQVGSGRVRVRHRDVRTGEPHEVEAAFVLGCDGANSRVRQSIGARMVDLGFEQRWLVMDVETEADLRQWDGVHQVCDSTRAATYMRVGATRHRWEFKLLDGETAADFGSLPSVEPLLRPWLRGVALDDLRLVRSTEYTFRAAVADRWRSGRVFLLGDAAHVTPPFIGQGLGAGVRDADNLAWKVAGFLDGTLGADVLDSYQAERLPHARASILLARQVGLLMCSGGRVGDAVRRLLVPVLGRIPLLVRQAVDSATPPLRASALTRADRRDRLAGRLCPNALDGRPALDERIGPGWALVTLRAPSPSCLRELVARGVTVVEAGDHPELSDWLRAGRCVAALVRPDRSVLASGDEVSTLVSTASSLLPPRTEAPA
ncbi:bifunctional 3-(3-hydroxy-phenyl)propionate/3-hydroxycinnamic acid hydroxylase [Actinokineospora sp. PR83]|uniref:bifunctional 3-(3-hydroxy-phenyl)propionate/3-hydroxycinnamic acid hydroxylase MhpA n=1 Tax=Actinokineospora sp. PR83 TaxID=2884908 RepID=UPI0027DFC4F3|nr:bifunctional 3-(3-hydroxy-phenyl)propionate/3-hydroxycinnamic acid hydroxylase [Actinokineospora sp. PR83]MCG8914514.1 bifunctional 3-(3-hydroxy-phenyl)propionate/3-hydroxycinnamic acid hydroxylase [Actinokineospora sp. PR83]